jgi:hypothetical protein
MGTTEFLNAASKLWAIVGIKTALFATELECREIRNLVARRSRPAFPGMRLIGWISECQGKFFPQSSSSFGVDSATRSLPREGALPLSTLNSERKNGAARED